MACPKCHGLMVAERDPYECMPHLRCLNCGKYLQLAAPESVYGPTPPAPSRKKQATTLAERQAKARDYARAYYQRRRARKGASALCVKCSRLRLHDSSFCHACREKNRARSRAAWRAQHPHAQARA